MDKRKVIKLIKKIIIVAILCLILTFALVGCSCLQQPTNDSERLFFRVETGVDNMKIYVHKETKVMYLWRSENGPHAGGLTVMLDENGKPLLWEEVNG